MRQFTVFTALNIPSSPRSVLHCRYPETTLNLHSTSMGVSIFFPIAHKGPKWNPMGSCPPVDVQLRSPYRIHGCNHVCQWWRHCIHRYSKRFRVCKNLKPFVIPTYEVPALLTHMVASIDPIGATSHWIPLRAFEQKTCNRWSTFWVGLVAVSCG